MKKKSFYLCSLFAAALMFTGCSDSEVTPGDEGNTGEGKELKVTFNFGEVAADPVARATVTTAKPPTDWSYITNLKIFMYDNTDPNKTIKIAREINKPTAGSHTETFTNVLTGNYTVVAIATTGSNFLQYGTNGADAKAWAASDMIGKPVKDMLIKHKNSTFPAAAGTYLNGKTAVMEPSEVFTGNAQAEITTTSNGTVTVNLVRDVSMMRVRLNVKHDNVKFVNWDSNAAVFIYRLPQTISIASNADGGGVSASNTTASIQFAENYWKTSAALPAGYTGSVATDADFTLWRDIVVFPNNGSRAGTASASKYFIAISATGGPGHKFADGSDANGQKVYWYNVVEQVAADGTIVTNSDLFLPNQIREVNLTVTTGGYKELPPDPKTYGNLKVIVNAPTAWGPISSTNIEL